ncbi:Lipopolysaccharide assembly protein B [Campylobacter majalis]|uniref:Lipopolysaccharide assembly protein B n=1 Tax=Campylobacter majalis TaxID=2790656 RepID=A0ABN7K805_9BACT|nr:hypothetical protein [Campylobacter majalis]CAD7286852.1 Lipopolysaccharide assembly protein B [Campylobacter majalis]
MDIFFIGHRDPIFGLIVLFGIIFIVAFFSYAWGLFRTKDEKRRIEKFIKKFDNSNSLSSEHKELLKGLELEISTLCFLGKTFAKNGDFEKAISIYLITLSKAKTKAEKEIVLTELGVVYFKAGFLQNSAEVFLQAVELSPRNTIALRFLTMIYEKLKRYNEALDTLNSLEALGSDVTSARAYINANIAINNKELSIDEKTQIILQESKNFKLLKRMAMQLWLKNGMSLDDFVDFPPLSDVIDIIYHETRPINLNNDAYNALANAKGLIQSDKQSEIFEVNVIHSLNKSGFNKAELSFSYVCDKCKGSFPMHFYRCPICHELGSVKILPHVTEKSFENSMPF